ncbi:MAG TPA: TetR/AcrR family transcriptional regulator [Povalibacter sp.]|uniref:TetR/AcrR family transcriptional regulator n=1 Tax=Povalibacter sp. TaxID=1962978 RepID=UPI002BA18342|nr:TetR/AcrR family transcriptional regulator [Povalibacter sp.]HMN47149.1 TetR/AcrR family transcriptional regulator [Povalibacter sp.]
MPRTAAQKTAKHPTPPKGRRLAPELRRAQILDAAARMVVEQGYLPLPIEQLGRLAGASKALVYAYFPTQYALFNALLDREFQGLTLAGFDTASRIGDLDQAAQLCAIMYYEHVARSGPLLHILMTDLYMKGHIEPRLRQQRDAVLQRLLALATPALPLSEAEIVAAVEMMTAIPEEAGRLVFNNELDPTTARQICNGLIASSLKALRAPAKVSIPD